jgi:hypothetical protein
MNIFVIWVVKPTFRRNISAPSSGQSKTSKKPAKADGEHSKTSLNSDVWTRQTTANSWRSSETSCSTRTSWRYNWIDHHRRQNLTSNKTGAVTITWLSRRVQIFDLWNEWDDHGFAPMANPSAISSTVQKTEPWHSHTPWLWSDSELWRPSDRRFLAK